MTKLQLPKSEPKTPRPLWMKLSMAWHSNRDRRTSSKEDRNIQFGIVIIPTKPFDLANAILRKMKQAYRSALPALYGSSATKSFSGPAKYFPPMYGGFATTASN